MSTRIDPKPRLFLFPLAALALGCSLAAQAGAATAGLADKPLDLRRNVGRSDGRSGGEGRRESYELGPELPAPKNAATAGAASRDSRALGFAAGWWIPPPGEIVDADFARVWSARTRDERPRDEVYGFVILRQRNTRALRAELAALGLRVLGYHPNHALRVAIPRAALAEASAHSAVDWIGFARPWQKLHPNLMQRLSSAHAGEPLDLYLSLFESDLNAESTAEPVGRVAEFDPGRGSLEREPAASPARRIRTHGWQERALERLGAEIAVYEPAIHAFRARVAPERVLELAALDFVQFLETVEPLQSLHDRSIPMIGVDYPRLLYKGKGTSASPRTIGMVDTGMDIAHSALQDTYSISFDHTNTGLWTDSCGHGTHVCGTLLGEPSGADEAQRGCAPDIGYYNTSRFRTVKLVTNGCNGTEPPDLYWLEDDLTDEYTDVADNTSPAPDVVNMSLGTLPGSVPWVGSEAVPRFFDELVYEYDQTWIVASGNSGPGSSTLTAQATAKNVLAIGGVQTEGAVAEVSPGSSRGPCGDGRFKPELCAPSSGIVSVQAGTSSGLIALNGTSMAAPHVTGLAAQLVEHYGWIEDEPAALAALMMATSTSRNSAAIGPSSTTHLNAYGTGRVDGNRAHFSDSVSGWGCWFATLADAQLWSGDFEIGSGATRLVAVLHYKEPSSSSGASKALVSDWDLVLDAPPLVTTSFGDFDAGTSAVDNTEIVTLDDPAPGTWRWKVKPYMVNDEVKASVSVQVIYGDLWPDLTLELSTPDRYLKTGETGHLLAKVSNPGNPTQFIASAATVSVTGTDAVLSAATELEDDTLAEHADNPSGGTDVILGNIYHESAREIDWSLAWNDEGWKLCTVTADADNSNPEIWSQDFVVDGTPPEPFSSLGAQPPPSAQWTTNGSVEFTWSPTSDALSGLDDYWYAIGQQKPVPAPQKPLSLATSFATTLPASATSHYFHLWAVDRCGNWTSAASLGPYRIDNVKPAAATNLVSSSHSVGQWSTDATLDFTWTAALEVHSGLNGYSAYVATSPALPPPSTTFATVTSQTLTFPSGADGRYVCLRAVDKAGNWSDNYAVAGPYKIDLVAPAAVLGAPPTTSSLSIQLKPKATDSASGVSKMRFTNNAATWSPWVDFAGTVNWNLSTYGGSTLQGTKTIGMQVRDLAGNVKSVSAQTIYHP